MFTKAFAITEHWMGMACTQVAVPIEHVMTWYGNRRERASPGSDAGFGIERSDSRGVRLVFQVRSG